MSLDDLVALTAALDLRLKSGAATLADYGALARVRHELARRGGDARMAQEKGPKEA